MTLAEPGTPRDVQGTWIGDELARTLARVDTLVRALEAVQGGLRLQQEEIARLTDQLHMVDGRSQRHEAATRERTLQTSACSTKCNPESR